MSFVEKKLNEPKNNGLITKILGCTFMMEVHIVLKPFALQINGLVSIS